MQPRLDLLVRLRILAKEVEYGLVETEIFQLLLLEDNSFLLKPLFFSFPIYFSQSICCLDLAPKSFFHRLITLCFGGANHWVLVFGAGSGLHLCPLT